MKTARRFVAITTIAALAGLSASGAKNRIPDWLAEAVDMPTPKFDEGETPSVAVLWDEGIHEFQEDGKRYETYRYAIRILEPSGVESARAYASYREGSAKIVSFKGWAIDDEGEVYAFKNREITDVSTTHFALYSESRAKTIEGEQKCRVGSVFAYEYVREEKSIFSQIMWWFQMNSPVARSRLEIRVPDGWTVADRPYHGAPSARMDGNRFVWVMENLPEVETEYKAPYSSVKRASIAVDIVPSDDYRVKYATLRFGTWEDLSNYTADIQDPQMRPTAEIVAKAEQLTSGATDTWSKVKAIGEYVKDLRYASINMDLDQGGGYIPRSASEVFEVGYGDCKDKTNLLRSMLGVAGIKAYPVVVNATNNDRVNEDWPSPFYFNHCIAAIEIDESVDTPAIVDDPSLGRLLFFDPTSSLTPVGELPFDEQGGLSVIGKRGFDRLVRLPQAPPEANRTERSLETEILANGAIIGNMQDVYFGKKADDERRLRIRNDESGYQSIYEQWISDGNASAIVKLRRIDDRAASDRSFQVDLEFAIPGYAQNMRNRLLIFKPAILSRMEDNPFGPGGRSSPIKMEPSLLQEEATIYLPRGFAVDEMKEEISLQTEFASYLATLEQIDDKLLYKRSLKFNDTLVPPANYEDVREFYRQVIDADQSPVVLVRSGS